MCRAKTKKSRTCISAFTLVELMVTILIASIAMLAIGNVLVGAHRGYQQTWERVYHEVVTQAYTSRLAFDRICRKSSRYYEHENPTSINELYVYYYSDDNPTKREDDPVPDRYAHFYTVGNILKVDYGDYDALNISTPHAAVDGWEELANNAFATFFRSESGNVVQMVLTLDDGEQGLTVTCSSLLHN